MRTIWRCFGGVSLLGVLAWALPAQAGDLALDVVDVRKIWDQAPHSAFTDLIRFRDAWWCAFREGQGHVSPDGRIRVLTSADGTDWQPAALLGSSRGDLRDPKLCLTPAGELMLTTAVARRAPDPESHHSLAWFSSDGRAWGSPVDMGDPNYWLWRVTWHQGTAYSIGYATGGERGVRLYASRDGRRFEALVPNLFDRGYPNETGVVFLPDETFVCLLRRDGEADSAQLGTARPPYTSWQWRDLGANVGGPVLIRLPDEAGSAAGQVLAAGRLYDGRVRTAVLAVDMDQGALRELANLPSSGDSSYPGLVWHAGQLWMSYYSSHEGPSSIYLARLRVK